MLTRDPAESSALGNAATSGLTALALLSRFLTFWLQSKVGGTVMTWGGAVREAASPPEERKTIIMIITEAVMKFEGCAFQHLAEQSVSNPPPQHLWINNGYFRLWARK